MVVFLFFISCTAFLESLATYIVKEMIDKGLIAKNPEMFFDKALYYALIHVLISFSVMTFILCAGKLNNNIQRDLRKKIFTHIQTMSFSFFDRTPAGWVLSRIDSDTSRIGELVSWMLVDVLWAVSMIIYSFSFMFILNSTLAGVILLVLPILFIVAFYLKKRILASFRSARKINSQLTAYLSESINGVRTIKSLSREKRCHDEFSETATQLYTHSYRAEWISSLFLPLVHFLSALSLIAVIVIGEIDVSKGVMSIGAIKAFISYIAIIMWPVQSLANVYASFQKAIASAERVFGLLDETPEVRDLPEAQVLTETRGALNLKDVSFSYVPEQKIISKLNLSIAPGEHIALVGPTGGGKTTLANLLMRFYDPQEGSIELDGVNIQNYILTSFHKKCGLVLQSPHLISGSIADNIKYGNPEASYEEIETAAKLTGIHDFIKALPKGYASWVGEGGVRLSNGEKQLISIVRALVSQPSIVVLDEATSHVDSQSEERIQKGLSALMKGKTSIIIAHRLSTIRHAHRILFLSKGEILEMGSHDELMALKSEYYQLYTTQVKN